MQLLMLMIITPIIRTTTDKKIPAIIAMIITGAVLYSKPRDHAINILLLRTSAPPAPSSDGDIFMILPFIF
jgi:hypothetical protein